MSKQTNNCIIFLPCPAGPGRAELHRGGGVPGLGGVRAAGGSRDPRGQGARSPEGDLQVRPRNFNDTITEYPPITEPPCPGLSLSTAGSRCCWRTSPRLVGGGRTGCSAPPPPAPRSPPSPGCTASSGRGQPSGGVEVRFKLGVNVTSTTYYECDGF